MYKTTTFIRSINDYRLSGMVNIKNEDKLIESIVFIILLSFFLYTKLIYVLTRFWPFSLYWRKKRFHYDNRYISKATIMIEETLEKLGKPFYVVGAGGDEYFYSIFGRFMIKKKFLVNNKIEAIVKNLLGLGDGEVFIRISKNKFKEIMLDRESLEKAI